jgi:uncharacterized protein (DUF362 family)
MRNTDNPEPAAYLSDYRTAVWTGQPRYAAKPPFHPSEPYPEYMLKETGVEPNPAYEGVRDCLRMLDPDRENYGTRDWNPLKGIVRPGDNIVLKPNFVLSSHSKGGDLFSIITHPSILRAVIDYVYKALEGQGKITIADAPQMDCNFNELLEATQLAAIQDLYRRSFGFEIDILDLRDFWLDARPGDTAAYSTRRFPLPGDPLGSSVIDLGRQSAFFGKDNWNAFYGADYARDETIMRHHGEVQEYVISNTVLNADVFISLPKLKTHKKVGVTLNAKGLVGITTNKNCLVHYTLGTPEEGGDQYPPDLLSTADRLVIKLQRFLYDTLLAKKNPALDRLYHLAAKTYKTLIQPTRLSVSAEKRIMDFGNWRGNDSAWRMVADLMRIVVYADKDGRIRETPQRRILSFIDGIVGGENDGPLAPDPTPSGAVISGFNPLAVDIAAARLMGLDFRKLKWVTYLLESQLFGLSGEKEIEVISTRPEITTMFDTRDRLLNFRPHPGWRNYLEL